MLPQRAVVLQALRPDGMIVGEWSVDPLMLGSDPIRLVRKDGPLDVMPENMLGSWSCGIQENKGGVTWTNNPASGSDPRNDAVHPILVSGAFDPSDVTLPWSVIHSPSRRYLVFHVHELEYRGIPVHLKDESTCEADELPDVWVVENGKRIR